MARRWPAMRSAWAAAATHGPLAIDADGVTDAAAAGRNRRSRPVAWLNHTAWRVPPSSTARMAVVQAGIDLPAFEVARWTASGVPSRREARQGVVARSLGARRGARRPGGAVGVVADGSAAAFAGMVGEAVSRPKLRP